MSELSVQLYTVREALEQDLDGDLRRSSRGSGSPHVEPFALAQRLPTDCAMDWPEERPDRTHDTRPPGWVKTQDAICRVAAELGDPDDHRAVRRPGPLANRG